MNYIAPCKLTELHKLHSLVEHRNRYSLNNCELNVFETHKQASDFHLQFEGFTITSMLRGKKVMRLEGREDFEYVPGETVLAPSETLMRIDFPEAEFHKPTQCTALVLDNHYLAKQLEQINTEWVSAKKEGGTSLQEWKLDLKELVLENNFEVAQLSNALLQAFNADGPFKEFQVDLLLKQLVLCLLKLQNFTSAKKASQSDHNSSPFHAVLDYIHKNLHGEIKIEVLCKIACMSKSSFYRMFMEEYGLSPVQLVLEERIKYAKSLLTNPNVNINEVAYAAGFNCPNYFSRVFKKMTGKSPRQFRGNSFGKCKLKYQD